MSKLLHKRLADAEAEIASRWPTPPTVAEKQIAALTIALEAEKAAHRDTERTLRDALKRERAEIDRLKRSIEIAEQEIARLLMLMLRSSL